MNTVANAFGLWRQYQHRPSYDPDSVVDGTDLRTDSPPPRHSDPSPSSTPTASATTTDPAPAQSSPSSVLNYTTNLLMNWVNSGSSQKSNGEVNRLVNDVLQDPKFSVEELRGFDAGRANRKLDAANAQSKHLNGFSEASISIDVPSGDKNQPSQKFTIPGLYFRKITGVIRAAFASPLASQFHLSPFKLFRKLPETGMDERVYSELYNSDAFRKEHDNIQCNTEVPPDDPHCKLEKIIAAVMLWSDGTHLANFGTAKLWPIYLFLGNLSKYTRSQPSSHACMHVAYIPSLPDFIQDQLSNFHAKWGTQKKDILTHCRRELMHSVWHFLLDDEFLHAYKYGMVITCADGVKRRVYPRIFTYSADYPEK